jgi:hypothetical protein
MSALLVVELTIAANDHKFTMLLFQILLDCNKKYETQQEVDQWQ